MTIAASPPGLQPEEYDEIEAAVMSTSRGRLFMAEHARRVRSAESARMLAAIERLEARLEAQQALAPVEAFTLADRLTELSWSLRERGVEDFVCGKIDALARELSGAGGVARAAQQPAEPTPVIEAPGRVVEASAPAPAPVEPVAPVVEKAGPEEAPPIEPVTHAPERAPADPRPDERLAALSWLDRLPLVDRFALFA
ncbi:hypothetical protein [Methylocystis parvus]|uniref:hypothetical protein n=1 Tax=Methylocystis parvus TaxID=134 RepID=UPI003C76C3E5